MSSPTDNSIPPGYAKIADVVLTPEEHRECLDFIKLVTHSEGGEWFARPDVAESIQRHFMAMAMMGRAERFAMLSRSTASYREQACEAAAKASALYPTAVNVFDFAKILDECGHPEDARTMYTEFLRRHEAQPLSAIDVSIEASRDLPAMVAYANQRIGTQ